MGGNFSTAPGTLVQEGLQQEQSLTWETPEFGFRCAWSPNLLKPSNGK
jgi:hypothetical protein